MSATTKRLDKLYTKISNENSNNKADNYFYIAQIKYENPDSRTYEESLYLDIKFFIELYSRARANRDFGYDVVDIQKILTAIYFIDSFEERLALLTYAYKELKNNQFEEESETLISYIRKEKLRVLCKSTNKKIIKIFSHIISYNLIVVVAILLIVFIISYIILLPAYDNSWSIVEFQYKSFHENFYINHLFNLLDYLMNISEDVNIKPIDWKGVLLVSSMKLFYVIFIVNYLFQVILERFKLNK